MQRQQHHAQPGQLHQRNEESFADANVVAVVAPASSSSSRSSSLRLPLPSNVMRQHEQLRLLPPSSMPRPFLRSDVRTSTSSVSGSASTGASTIRQQVKHFGRVNPHLAAANPASATHIARVNRVAPTATRGDEKEIPLETRRLLLHHAPVLTSLIRSSLLPQLLPSSLQQKRQSTSSFTNPNAIMTSSTINNNTNIDIDIAAPLAAATIVSSNASFLARKPQEKHLTHAQLSTFIDVKKETEEDAHAEAQTEAQKEGGEEKKKNRMEDRMEDMIPTTSVAAVAISSIRVKREISHPQILQTLPHPQHQPHLHAATTTASRLHDASDPAAREGRDHNATMTDAPVLPTTVAAIAALATVTSSTIAATTTTTPAMLTVTTTNARLPRSTAKATAFMEIDEEQPTAAQPSSPPHASADDSSSVNISIPGGGLFDSSIYCEIVNMDSSSDALLDSFLLKLVSSRGATYTCWCRQIATHSFLAARKHIRKVHGGLEEDEYDREKNSDDEEEEQQQVMAQAATEGEKKQVESAKTNEAAEKVAIGVRRKACGTKQVRLLNPPTRRTKSV